MDNKEFELIYSNNFKKLYKFFYYKTLNKHIAEDLTSDTFIRFANQVKDSVENLEKYLFGIAKIVFTEYLKEKYRSAIPVDMENFADYVDEVIEEYSDKDSLEDNLLKILPSIPDKQREIISLRLIEKLKPKETAAKLKKSMIYVKTTQNRAIKSLKKILETKDFI